MTYKTDLQANNVELQELIDIANTLPDANSGEQATPEISVSSNGLITATAGTKSSTYQLAFQPAKTITPSTASQIAVSSGYYTGGDVVVAGDSNLVAGNIKSGVSIFGVAGTLVEGGGTSSGELVDYSENEDAMVTRTLTIYSNNRVTTIGIGAFHGCSRLTSINFPVCTTIGNAAFSTCTSLTSINFPACTTIGSYAFHGCDNLTSVSFPACTTIGSNAFYWCSSLTSINFPVCTTIRSGAFSSCTRLTSVSFPACTTIGSNAFYSCRILSSLTLGASKVCTLSNSKAFTSTPYARYSSYFSGTPYIYVPSSLLTSYQTATNWTYFSSYFSAIESLEND